MLAWFTDYDEKEGVLFVPASQKVFNEQPIHWIFVADCSGSMLTMVGKITQWEAAKMLMNEALKNIQSQKRENDILTLICFNDELQIVYQNIKINDVSESDIARLDNVKPSGFTDIELANAMVHNIIMNDPEILQGRRNVAELFFTDGCANRGLSSPMELYQQKVDLNTIVLKNMNQPKDHFIWCAAIGQGDRELVEKMSQASRHSLWMKVTGDQMLDFAKEMGIAIATALCSRYIKGETDTHKTYSQWILNDTCGMIYTEGCPIIDGLQVIFRSNIVELYKIQHSLMAIQNDVNFSYSEKDQVLLNDYAKKLEKLKDPPVIIPDHFEESDMQAVTLHYTKTWTEVTDLIQSLLQCFQVGMSTKLDYQYSLLRASSGVSKTVQSISDTLWRAVSSQVETVEEANPEEKEKPNFNVFLMGSSDNNEDEIIDLGPPSPPPIHLPNRIPSPDIMDLLREQLAKNAEREEKSI